MVVILTSSPGRMLVSKNTYALAYWELEPLPDANDVALLALLLKPSEAPNLVHYMRANNEVVLSVPRSENIVQDEDLDCERDESSTLYRRGFKGFRSKI